MRFATGKKQRIAAALAAALALALAGCAAKPVAVDPAPCLSVTFAGMSGEGTASWSFDSEGFAAACGEDVKDAAGLAACVNGSLDKAEGLSNGDTVTFQWNCDAETAEKTHNALLAPQDVTFTVEGLDEWVSALDQIGQEDWDSLAAAGEETLRQREGDAIISVDCLGGYMLVGQEAGGETANTHNMLYVVYKVQARLPDASVQPYYAAIGSSDLVRHSDGSVEVTGDSNFPAYGNIDVKVGGEYYNFTGFYSLDELNTQCIALYEGVYSVESNVSEA